ncbi:unnamed protein product [Amaranthus hypochondriacus]
MAAVLKLRGSFHRLKPLLLHQRFCHTFVDSCSKADFFDELGPIMASPGDAPDTSKWKKMDSRSKGITLSNIPYAPKTVVKRLKDEGYDAFLVGGCVRDLLLKKTPKDFDVVTTASLKQVKEKFPRAVIVGRRFPVCLVHVARHIIEVSSFETSKDHEKGNKVYLSKMPEGYDGKDFLLWRNSLHRDFTVNSFFYDPYAHKIYDYSNGMEDLSAKKLRTLVPAHSSFQVDRGRILRGIRIAARLGFSFAKDTEKAIHDFHDSVKTLDKSRLMLEMNNLFSYGAAQSSLLLLKRFNLFDSLYPFHAAYLADQSDGQTPLMLMKLFSSLDSVVSLDHPCDSTLWISLMVFHLALANHPQDTHTVWILSHLLYHGTWIKSVKTARKHFGKHVNFSPEITNSFDDVADEKLAQKVSDFASIIVDYTGALTNSKNLCKIMNQNNLIRICHSPTIPHIITKKASREVAEIFSVLVDDIKSLNMERIDYKIDYELLKKGAITETRFVLGKIIMDTMGDEITHHRTKLLSEKDVFHASEPKIEQVEHGKLNSKDVKKVAQNHEGRTKRGSDGRHDQMQRQTKKQKIVKEKLQEFLTEKSQQGAELEICQHSEALTPKEMSTILEKVPTMEKQHQTLAPKEIPTILEKVSTLKKQHQTQTSNQILHVLKNAAKLEKQHEYPQALEKTLHRKPKASTEMLNILKLSSHFKGDEEPSKKFNKPEKQPTVQVRDLDASRKTKATRKLSVLFK